MQGGLHAANAIVRRLERRHRGPAVQVPRPRQRRRHRPLPGHLQRPRHPPQRLPGLGRVDVRPPRLPQRLREPHLARGCAGSRWLVGHRRAERVFSVAHTGGDLSTPAEVLCDDPTQPVPGRAGTRTPPEDGVLSLGSRPFDGRGIESERRRRDRRQSIDGFDLAFGEEAELGRAGVPGVHDDGVGDRRRGSSLRSRLTRTMNTASQNSTMVRSTASTRITACRRSSSWPSAAHHPEPEDHHPDVRPLMANG